MKLRILLFWTENKIHNFGRKLDGKRENDQLIVGKKLPNSFTFVVFGVIFLRFVWMHTTIAMRMEYFS